MTALNTGREAEARATVRNRNLTGVFMVEMELSFLTLTSARDAVRLARLRARIGRIITVLLG